ncbi:type VI immunity family protein (plasmid) [Agrobacterium sp. rho-13.3]|uniref:type VI immunity family protein n=1 Tax=Agrobacterium sp. rho-13.3 TaxID=3072980 RepID=UPI002A1818F9|nr:type VI immunity family protein [Agrobacterium sp. rho-13.3]MDX8310220.1 DUF3396 domain-containing protein [Agrobacterium sp. rho-13.3]
MTKDTNSFISEAILKDLRIEDEDGCYYATTGLTLSFMYAQRMEDMVAVFRQMVEEFSKYMSPLVLDAKVRNEWTDYTPKQLSRLLNCFSAYSRSDQELVLAKLDDEGPFQYFGEFGIRIIGRSATDTSFAKTDVCAAYFEVPMHELERVGRPKILEFIKTIAGLAPFQHGMCGYSFKYFHRAGDSDIHAWMGDKALRYFAIHPMMNDFEYYCRHELPNVNWVTLLGQEMTTKIGGAQAMRSVLSDAVEVESLSHGTMLVAGEAPPLGDRNELALDLGPLREVANLTQPLLLNRNRQMNSILNYVFSRDEERAERWLNRFDWKPGID